MIKKLIRNIQLYDGVWSIPLAFIAFFLAGKYSVEYFGDAIISTEYLQYVILASLIMVFANFIVFLFYMAHLPNLLEGVDLSTRFQKLSILLT